MRKFDQTQADYCSKVVFSISQCVQWFINCNSLFDGPEYDWCVKCYRQTKTYQWLLYSTAETSSMEYIFQCLQDNDYGE